MAFRTWLRGFRPTDLRGRLGNTVREGWHLGFTAFGGPPVHFKIVSGLLRTNALQSVNPAGTAQLYDKYVTKAAWVDEQLYQELFSVTQAISGPASTKMLYCINLLHDGFLASLLGFLMWRYDSNTDDLRCCCPVLIEVHSCPVFPAPSACTASP